MAEGIDFDRHYGRCVILFGIPYQYTLSHTLRARLNYMRERYNIRDNDFLTFDALRQSAQCVGRVIRSKTDYGVVILADSRYNRADKRSKFPPWILQFLKESSMNLPTDGAVDQIKLFLRQMGQPVDQESLHSILLNEHQVNSMFHVHKVPATEVLLQGMTSHTHGVGAMEVDSEAAAGVGLSMDKAVEGEVYSNTNGDVVPIVEGPGVHKGGAVVQESDAEDSVVAEQQEYMMDVVGGISAGIATVGGAGAPGDVGISAAVAVDTSDAADVSGAAARRRAGGHSKSLFLFEDILDTSDTE